MVDLRHRIPSYSLVMLTWIVLVARTCNALRNVPLHEETSTETTDEGSSSSSSAHHRRLTKVDFDAAAFQEQLDGHLPLFQHSTDIQVLGPSAFPKPSDYHKTHPVDDIVINVEPVFGKHRRDQDVVMAFAAEYPLKTFVLFIESLRDTGFTGDIVLAVHELDVRQDAIREYLSTAENVVIYAPKQTCFNAEMEEVESVKGGMRICQCHHLYGRRESVSNVTALPDPRPARTVAVTRYELYWIFTRNYNPEQWILLVDARDTYFQTNPFADVPRKTDPTLQSGVLYFFGENVDATRLGRSKQNNKWLLNAYGQQVADSLTEKPTVCSGATMGEQVAVETYLRAMVRESDETKTVLVGADQGFHNFLYYSHKLSNANRIHDIVVFDQGTGVVNNMGAMRTAPLKEWGNGDIVRESDTETHVLNWDGTVSPVVHQFDRHKSLSVYFFKKRGQVYMQKWRAKSKTKPDVSID